MTGRDRLLLARMYRAAGNEEVRISGSGEFRRAEVEVGVHRGAGLLRGALGSVRGRMYMDSTSTGDPSGASPGIASSAPTHRAPGSSEGAACLRHSRRLAAGVCHPPKGLGMRHPSYSCGPPYHPGGQGWSPRGNVCQARARRATFVLSILSLAPSLSSPWDIPQVDRTRPQPFSA